MTEGGRSYTLKDKTKITRLIGSLSSVPQFLAFLFMKRFPNYISLRKWLFTGLCTLGLTVSSQALIIDFEPPGYEADSSLSGSGTPGGTLWTLGGSALAITEGVGVGNSQGLLLKKPSGASDGSNFATSLTDLPGFDPSTSVVRVDFSFRFAEPPATGSARTNVSYFQIGNGGSSPAARITFYHNGTLGYHINRASPVDIASSLFQATDAETWYQASILLDYLSGTYSFSLNGVELTAAGVFRNTGHDASLRFLTFGTPDHRQMAFDNISMTVIPEPGTIGLLLAATGLLVGRLRLRTKGGVSKLLS